jgi:hypothetical protein
VLARLARGKARRKISELAAALEGAELFTAGHAALLAAMLARIDRVSEEIARLTEVIERLLAPYEEELQQAGSMPGWGRRAAQDALAGTGADMSRFPSGGHLASGPAVPRWTASPASATGKPGPGKATGTRARSPARPPSRPAARRADALRAGQLPDRRPHNRVQGCPGHHHRLSRRHARRSPDCRRNLP